MQMEPQRIADDMVVSIAYRLKVDGEEIARATADDPLEYLHGAEDILPGLEAALEGKKVGDRFSITLSPEEGYGEYDEENIEEIDRADIPDADQLQVGMVVEVEDEDGYSYMAHVTEMNEHTVVLDFNPPLAGKTLSYDVEVVDVRMADEEELAHGHVHSAFYDEDFDEEFDEE
ncbi:MAG TPA: peptidylprolyl isomerase [Oceanobacillus sp.]|nr:peptidylprolyl isomerase [Oceanobacillus sp.]